jgi:acetyl esterase/lipase
MPPDTSVVDDVDQNPRTPPKRSLLLRIVLWTVGFAVVVTVGSAIAFQVSPWPAVLLIRYSFDKGAAEASRALERHLPRDVTAVLNEQYDPGDGQAYLDVFYPSAIADSERRLLTVVWVHGGAWVSGRKDDVSNYAKILAGKGITVVSVNYSIAPGATYPAPVRQVTAALAYLVRDAARLHVDPSRFVLAGDSAGAHIAAQVANIIAVPSYAQAVGELPTIERSQLVAALLYCGPYSIDNVNLTGPFGDFQKTVLWAYSGGKDFGANRRFATASIINYVTSAFPPAFISAGNADPLQPQSVAFAGALESHGVAVERLFFVPNYKPALPHEYQFNLDTEAGRLALDRSVRFLEQRR